MKCLLPSHVFQPPRSLPHRHQCYQLLLFPSRIIYVYATTSLDCIYAVLLVWPLGLWLPYFTNAWWSLAASSALREVLTAEWSLWWTWACPPWSSLTRIPVSPVFIVIPAPTMLVFFSESRPQSSVGGKGEVVWQSGGRIWGVSYSFSDVHPILQILLSSSLPLPDFSGATSSWIFGVLQYQLGCFLASLLVA